MPHAILDERALLSVAGEDAETFLQSLVTTDLGALAKGEARPGALLSPQGKILFDFLVWRQDGGFALDCRSGIAADFLKRLTLYRLRAKVQISLLPQYVAAIAWGDDSPGSETDSTQVRDLRFKEPVWRKAAEADAVPDGAEEWSRLRISAGVAESGSDYVLGDAFPHDVNLDQTGGLSFRKGCYVGQEVVSRMQHRGTARRRILIARGENSLPPAGTSILAGERPIGDLGTVDGQDGLALARIDKVKDAMDAGQTITAGGVAILLTIPPGAGFRFPETAGGDGE